MIVLQRNDLEMKDAGRRKMEQFRTDLFKIRILIYEINKNLYILAAEAT